MVLTQRPSNFSEWGTWEQWLMKEYGMQLCIAHYCDVHGPTPIMVTEGFPAPCSTCAPGVDGTHTSTAAQAHSVADTLRKMTLSTRSSSLSASEPEPQNRAPPRKSKPAAVNAHTPTPSAIATPPQSPGLQPEATSEKPPGTRRESNFHRTYDEYVTKRASPCQSCALTLPKRTDIKNAASASGNSAAELRGPTLRSRTPYARVYCSRDETSPPASHPQSSCASDAEDDHGGSTRPAPRHRPASSTSHSTASYTANLPAHTHYLDYISTHEPQVTSTYSIVRAACLRTLSFETLPRRPDQGYASSNSSKVNSPVSSAGPSLASSLTSASPIVSANNGYISSSSIPQSAAAGAIFFGDPVTGFTMAYIFRIPDMHARGRKRVYAFMIHSMHREHVAMRGFQLCHAEFRHLANWMQDLAEAAAERDRAQENPLGGGWAGYGGGPRDVGVGLGLGGGGNVDRGDSGSSFLTGGGRSSYMQRMGMGGSLGPGGFAPKARGLPELLGQPDFFLQLHKRFVELSFELGVTTSL